MFCSMKMEEYMKSEYSGIFRVKLVTKNIVLRSPGTHFMHMRVKINDMIVNPDKFQAMIVSSDKKEKKV